MKSLADKLGRYGKSCLWDVVGPFFHSVLCPLEVSWVSWGDTVNQSYLISLLLKAQLSYISFFFPWCDKAPDQVAGHFACAVRELVKADAQLLPLVLQCGTCSSQDGANLHLRWVLTAQLSLSNVETSLQTWPRSWLCL